ncbi:MAG: hypothetical protein U0235_06095 [Polyangiaceae bacterium]
MGSPSRTEAESAGERARQPMSVTGLGHRSDDALGADEGHEVGAMDEPIVAPLGEDARLDVGGRRLRHRRSGVADRARHQREQPTSLVDGVRLRERVHHRAHRERVELDEVADAGLGGLAQESIDHAANGGVAEVERTLLPEPRPEARRDLRIAEVEGCTHAHAGSDGGERDGDASARSGGEVVELGQHVRKRGTAQSSQAVRGDRRLGVFPRQVLHGFIGARADIVRAHVEEPGQVEGARPALLLEIVEARWIAREHGELGGHVGRSGLRDQRRDEEDDEADADQGRDGPEDAPECVDQHRGRPS